MNELAEPVGANVLYYYPTLTDALANTNQLGSLTENAPTPFTVGQTTSGTNGGYTRWLIANNSTGSSSQLVAYNNGDSLINDGTYYLYPSAPCFKEGTKVLCQIDGKDSYEPIESLKVGTLVKTSRDGYKKIELIGSGIIYNPGTTERIQQRLYKCSTSMYKELTEDLYITGCHSILVNNISVLQRQEMIKQLGRIFITDKKYRLTAMIDDRAEPWAAEGNYTIWHLALEHSDEKMNYGIYVNGGLLVETCSIHSLKNKSNFSQVL
jgi:hypothetical protein